MTSSKIHRAAFGAALLVLCGASITSAQPARGPSLDRLGQQRFRPVTAPATVLEGCDGIRQSIACGETVTTTIRNTDCETDAGVFYDVFFFSGTNGQQITATMTSPDFDPYLVLFNPDVEDVAEDDDSGPDDGSQITFTLNRTSADWSLTPTPLEVGQTGTYTLTLSCSGTAPAGFFTNPAIPGFAFKVTIRSGTTTIPGRVEASCLQETICVSGAIPGRPEVFLRVVGPRPNGFLWPTLVKFTTSEVEIVVRQLSTGAEKTYLLPGATPNNDVLPGLFDRTGFLP